MTLPVAPNSIAMSQVNVEAGQASNATRSLNDVVCRQLAGIASGEISMDDLRGKSWAIIAAITPSPIDTSSASTPVQANATGSATNGSGSYTYSWVMLTQTGGFTVNIINPTSATPTFSASIPSGGGIASGDVRLTVTDTIRGISDTVDAYVELERL